MRTWGAAGLAAAALLVPAAANAGAVYGSIFLNGAGLKGAATQSLPPSDGQGLTVMAWLGETAGAPARAKAIEAVS